LFILFALETGGLLYMGVFVSINLLPKFLLQIVGGLLYTGKYGWIWTSAYLRQYESDFKCLDEQNIKIKMDRLTEYGS